MAGGNRYKHRSLGGGLVPNNQQAPSNNFYAAPSKRDYLAEALALAQSGMEGTAQAGLTGIGEALSNPTKSLAALLTPGSGAIAVNDALAKPAAEQLVRDWGGVKPAIQSGKDAMALVDILSGKEKSVPFAPAYAGQKASDTITNAGTAVMDASTFLPTGVARSKFDDVPSLSKFDEFAAGLDAKNAAAMADNSSMGVGSMSQVPRSGGPSFGRDETRVARVMASQDSTLGMGFPFSGKDGEKPLLSALMDSLKGKSPPGAGAAAKTVEEQAPPGAFFAYHGSPHDFDRFDLSKIGTGEGAQAYGRGLYFAESPKTGQAYRDAMLFDAIQAVKDPARREAAIVLHRNNWNVAAAQKELGKGATPEQIKMLSDVAENPPGGLYKVKIAADPNAFKEFEAPPTEAEIEAMKKAGIPGLKYFDNGSRASEKGTRNYVVFDDKLANIVEKNGKPFTPRSPLVQFTPPTSLDDIFTGGAPTGPRPLTGGAEYPSAIEGSAFNMNTPEVAYDPAKGFVGGLDAQMAKSKNAQTLADALAKAKGDKPPTLLGMGAPFEGKGQLNMGFPFGNDWKPLAENLKTTINTGDRNALAQQMAQLEGMSKGDVVNVAKSIEGYTPKSKVEAIEYIKERFEDAAQRARKNAAINRVNVNSMKQGLDSYLKSFGIDESFGPPPPKDPTKLGAGSPADSDLIKLLMAYGAFGGMSAGALATMDGQKQQGNGF